MSVKGAQSRYFAGVILATYKITFELNECKTVKDKGDYCNPIYMSYAVICYNCFSPGFVMSSQFSGLGGDPVITKAG